MLLQISWGFMDYALDCWVSNTPPPVDYKIVGKYPRQKWVGEINDKQWKELYAQACQHADMRHHAEYKAPELRPFIETCIKAKLTLEKLQGRENTPPKQLAKSC